MSPGIPWLPGGQDELPAERFIVFADDSNVVQRIDETLTTKDGASFTAEWQSPTLNQLDEGKEFQLEALEIFYAALAATTVAVSASADGGETWTTPQNINLLISAGQMRRVRADFDGVTGFDVRFRLQMDQDELVSIFGYRPHLVDRGDLIFS